MKIKQYRTSFLDHLFFASLLIVIVALSAPYIQSVNPTFTAIAAILLFGLNWLTSGVSVTHDVLFYKRSIFSKTKYIPIAAINELRSSRQKAIDGAVGGRSDSSLTLSGKDREDVTISNMPATSVSKIIKTIIGMKHATVRQSRLGSSDRFQLT